MNYKMFVASWLVVFLLAACSFNAVPIPQGTLEAEANYWEVFGLFIPNSGGFGKPAVASDGTNITVAFHEYDSSTNQVNVRVKRWNGTTWTDLGDSLSGSSVANSQTYNNVLALDPSGNPVVAWDEEVGSLRNIYVQRFNGTTWENLTPSGLNGSSYSQRSSQRPSLDLDSSGNPVVAWFESDGSGVNIYVQRFDGTNWIPIGVELGSFFAFNPSLTLDSSDNDKPVLAWVEEDLKLYVVSYNGTSWESVGSPLDWVPRFSYITPSLALDGAGNPTIAYQSYDGSVNNVYVQRFDGTTWGPVGGVLSGSSASGSDVFDVSLALNPSGDPVVAWDEDTGSSRDSYVRQFNGGRWVNLSRTATAPIDPNPASSYGSPVLSRNNTGIPLVAFIGPSDGIHVSRYFSNAWLDVGGALDVQASQSATNSSITRRSNNPVVAWEEFDGSSKNIYVKEWNGSAWNAVGGALDKTLANNAQNSSIAMRSDNRPTVAFEENNNLYVRRWNNTNWVYVGGVLDTVLANLAVTPSLALDSSNLPVVAYIENGNVLVKKANGVIPSSSWTSPYGTTPLDFNAANPTFAPSLALKSDGSPVVAWHENDGSSTNVYVKEWNGSAWVLLGTTLDMTPSQNAKDVVLALRSDNRPVVVWEEIGNIYVKRWDGSAWQSVGGVLDKVASNEALRPALDLRSDNNPVVTWQEGTSANYNIYVKRWTGTTWANVSSSALDKTPSRTAQHPAIILKTNNNPIVAWDEADGSSENVYVEQY